MTGESVSHPAVDSSSRRWRYSHRLRIWESDYGRTGGWIVERQGQPIALLTDPISMEMFWYSYRLTPTTTDKTLQAELFMESFWARAEDEELVWRSCELGDVAVQAFPALSPFPEAGRLAMRGLYISIPTPCPWDRAILWLRKLKALGSGRAMRP